MEKLIVKGGFRERANRHRKYVHSENQQTTLKPNDYAEHLKVTSETHDTSQDIANNSTNSTDKKTEP
ncbi:MAG: hypothetical protein QM666_07470 [Acinetobacter sp.]